MAKAAIKAPVKRPAPAKPAPVKKEPAKANRMIARHADPADGDDFPTPPWATRALFRYVLPSIMPVKGLWALEPACGRGHMVKVFKEQGMRVTASDLKRYSPQHRVQDFLTYEEKSSYDWVITNPPYSLGEDFFNKASKISSMGCALLMRLNWLQGESRFSSIFQSAVPSRKPHTVAIFSSRIPFAQGKLTRSDSGYFQHCWVVWNWIAPHNGWSANTRLVWIPPNAQDELEKDSDYE